MDKIDQYRQYIQDVLTEYGQHQPSYGEIEVELIFDVERDRYQIVHTGWHQKQRIYGCIAHLDLKDGKIWIQYDGTERGIANELIDLGVPKQDIVLAFHAPYFRQYTEFAIS